MKDKTAAELWRARLENIKSKVNLAHEKMYDNMNTASFDYWAERYSNNIRIFHKMLTNRPAGV